MPHDHRGFIAIIVGLLTAPRLNQTAIHFSTVRLMSQPDPIPLPPANAAEPPQPSTPEETPPMLDVHPPHEAAHTWQDFFIHIATIVVGLCIAIGLEQTVEMLHHHSEVRQMESDLRHEDHENQDVLQRDLQAIDQGTVSADAAIAMLQTPASRDGLSPIPPAPQINLSAPGNTAWLTMRDSGLLAIAPRPLVDNYWKVNFVHEGVITQFDLVYSNINELSALLSLQRPDKPISQTDREALLTAAARYRESLKALRIRMVILNTAIGLALHDQTINIDNVYAAHPYKS